MIDKNKQYKTRDGREVRIYATDGAGTYPVQGAIRHEDGWYLAQWKQSGKHVGECDGSNDLIEVKPRMKFERWIVLHRNGEWASWMTRPSDASTVDAFAIKHIVFEVEEGEGLDAV
jgi:hypothetical protein